MVTTLNYLVFGYSLLTMPAKALNWWCAQHLKMSNPAFGLKNITNDSKPLVLK